MYGLKTTTIAAATATTSMCSLKSSLQTNLIIQSSFPLLYQLSERPMLRIRKGTFTHPFSSFVFCIAVHFQITYLGWRNQDKLLQKGNSMGGKCTCKRGVCKRAVRANKRNMQKCTKCRIKPPPTYIQSFRDFARHEFAGKKGTGFPRNSLFTLFCRFWQQMSNLLIKSKLRIKSLRLTKVTYATGFWV